MAQGPGSTRQNNGPFTVGGFYNFSPFTLVDGQACALQFDVNGNLKTTTIGGGSGSNAAAGPTGAPVPADADYQGVNVGGTLFGVSGFNLASSVSMAVAIVDGSGNQITSFGGGTQYADAVASGNHPTGTQIIGWNKGGLTELAITALPLTNAQALAIAIVDGSGNQITSFGGGTQYADDAASGVAPTGTLSMGWDSVNSKIRALKVDTSQNLLVDVANTSLSVTQGTSPWVISFTAPQHVIVDSGSVTVSGTVSSTQGTSPWIVAGAKTPADSYANPTDAEDVFALLGGWDATNTKWQRIQVDAGTGTLKVDIGSTGTVAITGTVGVTQSTSPWVISFTAPQHVIVDSGSITVSGTVGITGTVGVTQSTSPWVISFTAPQHVIVDSGTVTANQGSAAALASAWPFEITDGTNGPVAVKPASTAALSTDPAVVVVQNSSTTASVVAQTSVGASSSTILAANVARREATIVNTGTTIIYLGLGRTPTVTAYHVALAPCSGANDGTGGTYTTDIFAGAINAIGSAIGGTVCVTELS